MKKIISLILCLTFIITTFSFLTVKAQTINDTNTFLNKTVYFGKYYNQPVTYKGLHRYISYNAKFVNDRAELDGVKFARKDGKFYQQQPIEWVILSDNGTTYTLISKYVIDSRADFGDFWHNSALRKWLNNEFYNEAFTKTEQAGIVTSNIQTYSWPYEDRYINNKPATYEITSDKVYLLSQEDTQNGKLGFETADTDSTTRIAYNTYFVDSNLSVGEWWLRGNGVWSYGNLRQSFVNNKGGYSTLYGSYAKGLRPVIKVKKSYVSSTMPEIKEIELPEEYAIYTTTDSVFPIEFNDISTGNIFSKFSNSIKNNYIIPGIERTNILNKEVCEYMVAQGTCIITYGNRKFLLISAYDATDVKNSDKKFESTDHQSVIYVIEMNKNEYVKTLVLPTNCHVGGLAYNPNKKEIYVADSDKNMVRVISYSSLIDEILTGGDSSDLSFNDERSFKVSNKPSFVTYYGGRIYVGTHVSEKSKASKSKMYAYSVDDGKLISDSDIKLPLKTQGAQFVLYKGKTYLFCSCSNGRHCSSELKIYEVKLNNGSFKIVKTANKESYKFPNMSEDIQSFGSNLYVAFESAAKAYQVKGNKCPYPIDRVTVHSISSLLKNFQNTRSVAEEGIIAEGKCGDTLTYTLYDSGYLNISGYGEMYDYSSSNPPWNNYKDSILSVDIDADVSKIGAKAFSGCTNLIDFNVSEFSAEQLTLSIENSALENCSSLQKVYLPEKNIEISDSVFANCSSSLTLVSESESVKEYASASEIDCHNHNFEFLQKIEPDCHNEGYDLYICSDEECGKVEAFNYVPATENHQFECIESKNADCQSTGYNLYECKVCGDSVDEEIPITHNYKNVVNKKYLKSKATPLSPAKYYKSCSCGAVSSSTFKYGEIDKTAQLYKVNGILYYYKNGKINKSNTLVKYNGKWYHVKGGKWVKDTTLVKVGKTYYYVKNGIKNTADTLVKYNNKLYHVKGGKWVKDTTLVKVGSTYYYVKNGIKNTADTLVKYNNKLYHVKGGKWVKDTAIVKYNKKQYYVKKGIVSKVTKRVKVGKKYYSVKNGVVVK